MTLAPLTRRSLFGALPATGAMLLLPAPAPAAGRSAVLDIIQELEGWQRWETISVIYTKAYVAYRLRLALDLEPPDPDTAMGHLHFQKGSWDHYRGSIRYELDQKEGRECTPPPGRLPNFEGGRQS